MNEVSFDDISRYVRQPLHFDRERFENIKRFIRDEMGYSELLSLFDNENSSKFLLCFRQDWSMVDRSVPMGERHYELGVHVSARGPLIASEGLEFQTIRSDAFESPAEPQTGFAVSSTADAKAREIAVAVADHFNLIYLDRDWLSQFKLRDEPESVTRFERDRAKSLI